MEIIVLLCIIGYIIYETMIFVKGKNIIYNNLYAENKNIIKIKEMLQQRDENLFANISEKERKYPALDYLATCAKTGQQINENNFKELLISKTNTTFSDLNTRMNQLPIIGLRGTFLGIIIGVLNIWFNIISIDTYNEEYYTLARYIIPLLFSAGLAFTSSLWALRCSSKLKSISQKERNKSDEVIDSAMKALVVDYIPYISPKSKEDRFAKTVMRLNNTINKFVNSLDEKLNGFISNFQPLIENQKQTNEETLKSMEDIATRLNQDYETIKLISNQQAQQINSFSNITEKLNDASSSMEQSIKLATENLNEFVKLGSEMKTNIGEMNEPLNSIIKKQEEITRVNEGIINEMKKLLENNNIIPSYTKSVQDYLTALNNKLDTFSSVGDKVHNVTREFDNFKENLDKLLNEFISSSQRFSETMTTSFKDYDRELRTLFGQTIPNKEKIDFYYYDPESISQLNAIAEKNNAMIDSIIKYSRSLEENLNRFNQEIDSLRVFGFIRKKKNNRKHKR